MRAGSLRVAALMAICSGAAAAGTCAGFSDVEDTSGFCPNIEWVRNRSITLGCESSTLYCPHQFVTRLAMAAFTNRLAAALTPVELNATEVAAPRSLAANPVVCATPDFVVAGFPRRAYVNTGVNLSAPDSHLTVSAETVYSTDAGASWSPVHASFQFATLYAGATPVERAALAPFSRVDLNVGQMVRFGVQLRLFEGLGSMVKADCKTLVRITNRNA